MMGFLTAEKVMLFTAPLTVFLIILESFLSARYEWKFYKWKDSLSNVFLAACFFLIDLISKGAGFIFISFFYFHGFQLAPDPKSSAVLYWILLILLQDVAYWLQHFLDHKVRFLWAGHIHHHSSAEFNFTVGIRSAVFEPIEKFVLFAPIALIGFRPIDIIFAYILSQAWGIFVHTRMIKKLGPLEYFMTTPSHHRVHHGRNVKYLDRNYGMLFIWWDKLFGTFEPEDQQEPVDFGIVKNVQYKNYPDIIFNEYRQIIKDSTQKLSLKQRLKYIFGPPGYSHDGRSKTAKELQEEQSPN